MSAILRDQAVRVELGIPLARAAKLAGVCAPTLRLYEADPYAVKGAAIRERCAALYERLRGLLDATKRAA